MPRFVDAKKYEEVEIGEIILDSAIQAHEWLARRGWRQKYNRPGFHKEPNGYATLFTRRGPNPGSITTVVNIISV